MKVLFICKRHPQQRDLIERPYGRFYYLPVALAALGHEVRVQLCSYRRLESAELLQSDVTWSNHDLLTLGPRALFRKLSEEILAFSPNWIIGCSDAWAGWLAHRLSRRMGSRLAIDAYDNYEAYMSWNLPLHWLWRRALRAADLVTAAGPQLAEKLASSRRGASSVQVLPMSSDPNFVRMDRKACRAALGLPQDAPLFGYSGGWTRSRGSHLVLDAFQLVRERLPAARLVLTGKPPESALSVPGIINLGYLDDALMPSALSAVDLCCVILADTSFGRYSYPAKLCEAMACGVPVVASATSAVAWMLGGDRQFLARVGDAEDHARVMLANYSMHDPAYVLPPSWETSAGRLSELLNQSEPSY